MQLQESAEFLLCLGSAQAYAYFTFASECIRWRYWHQSLCLAETISNPLRNAVPKNVVCNQNSSKSPLPMNWSSWFSLTLLTFWTVADAVDYRMIDDHKISFQLGTMVCHRRSAHEAIVYVVVCSIMFPLCISVPADICWAFLWCLQCAQNINLNIRLCVIRFYFTLWTLSLADTIAV